jgi:3D-(3,5/4)-trihydroxycyclohexane-1,2-dione acylhydrolase (decyclizing)
MSKTAFGNPDVPFVGVNVCELDAHKHAAVAIVADARAALEELTTLVRGYSTGADYRAALANRRQAWTAEVDRLLAPRTTAPLAQAEVIGVLNRFARPQDVVVCAAGSLPGDLHKLWRASAPNTYHLEYGYSCMGYEIAGGLGVKMSEPSREVYVMVGDGSYLMMAAEIVTSVQEGYKLIVLLLDSQGYASIGGLSRSIGSDAFGTQYPPLPVDLAANAASLGAITFRATDRASLQHALAEARAAERTTVIYVPVDSQQGVPGYESWWDVPVAEVSEQPSVRHARDKWEAATGKQRRVWKSPS